MRDDSTSRSSDQITFPKFLNQKTRFDHAENCKTVCGVCRNHEHFLRARCSKTSEPLTGKPVLIPTRYKAHRLIATPVTADNVRLSLFTDSAGRLFLYSDTAERLKLSVVTLPQKEHEGVRIVGLTNFKSGATIPPPPCTLFEMRS